MRQRRQEAGPRARAAVREETQELEACSRRRAADHLPFVDYSGMSIDNGRVAIASRENSMLWLGHFEEVRWSWRDEGQLYEFPRSDNGAIRYGNIEGVGRISSTRVVTVSDRRKNKSQSDKRLSEKDQSVHVFEIPL